MNSGFKIELVTKRAEVERWSAALDDLAIAIAAFEIVPGGDWRLEAYTLEPPDPAAVRATLLQAAEGARVALPAFHIQPLPPTDWLAENRRDFPVQSIGRFFIYGSHHPRGVPAGRIGLLVDAATAFGSGEHATTRGCLAALDRLSRRRRVRRPLDLGCGSGILALALAKLTRRPVRAADIDPESVRVARDNAALNGVARLVRVARSDGYRAPLVRRGRPYDVIVSNILAQPLCRFARDLRRHLAPGGVAVLSGLLVAQEAQVVAAHRRQGLVLIRRFRRDGWSTLEFSAGAHNYGSIRNEPDRADHALGPLDPAAAARSRRRGPMNSQTKYHTWYFIAAMIGILLLQQVWAQYQTVEHIDYSEFLTDLKTGKVAEVQVEGNYIAGTLKAPLPSGRTQFITTRVPTELAQDLEKYGVKFGAVVQSTWLTSLLGCLLFVGIWGLRVPPLRRQAGFRRADADRQEQGQDLCRDRHQGDI
ncbi:MAG: ATP-dependent metallopeptidase FtsH/Yme1/Tma family protein [Pseudomonadota bacterium]